MPKKHFIINPEIEEVDKESLSEIQRQKEKAALDYYQNKEQQNAEKLSKIANLSHVNGRVVVVINVEGKNSHTFESGQKIYIGRDFNNLNKRETQPVNAYAVSGDGIPKGCELILHHNAIQDSYKIFDFDDHTDVKYYSIPEPLCLLWKNNDGEWMPFKGYATGLRLFEPYTGTLEGIKPTKIPNTLYITSGEFNGKAVHTLRSCDYEMVFLGSKGTEERTIRIRHYENEVHEREEIVSVSETLTEKILKKEILVGLNESDAKFVNFD